MDVRLSGKDIYISDSGRSEYICGAEEALQRVLIAASTAKGSFIYDRGFGTDFSGLDNESEILKEELEMRFKEAAENIAGTEVRVASVDAENEKAEITVEYSGVTMCAEVDINGNI